jgi:hypothetical protein
MGEGAERTLVARISDAPVGRFSGCPVAVSNFDAAPSGGFAVAFGREEYLLRAFDTSGELHAQTVHDVPRVPLSEEELEAERGRLARIAGGVATEPDPYRNHFMGGSLRYDSAGRAWIRTERGGDGNTVFDVFAADATYLGEVSIPMIVKSPGAAFDVAGDFLVTVHLDDESATEFVTIWQVSWDE